jgi:hypothetical protein
VAQNGIVKLKHPSTHKFPEMLPAYGQLWRAGVMPTKWVPIAAETPLESHDAYFGFCPAKSQLYRGVVKPPRGEMRRCASPAIGR